MLSKKNNESSSELSSTDTSSSDEKQKRQTKKRINIIEDSNDSFTPTNQNLKQNIEIKKTLKKAVKTRNKLPKLQTVLKDNSKIEQCKNID
ncbi:hypothetical protein CAJAP_03307 [Camponotus japonicus]